MYIYTPKKIENIHLHKIIHKNSKVETIQMSISC